MDQSNIDDMFSQMLGELDDITQKLDEIPQSPGLQKSSAYSPYKASSTYSISNAQVTDFDEEDDKLTALLTDLTSFEESIQKPFEDENLNFSSTDHTFPNASFIQQKNQNQPYNPATTENKSLFTPNPPAEIENQDFSLDELSKEIDQDQLMPTHKPLSADELESLSHEEREEKIRSEKVRLALEKMKEARIQKLVVKVFNKDNSSKTLVIDERMTTRNVMKQLIEKNHFDFSPNWTLVEELPSLFLERMCEEHEKPCDTMKYWTRDTTNQLRFLQRKDKYGLFKNPQHYLLTLSDQQEKMQERQKQTLIEEFFSGKGPSSGVPEVEGYLHIKNGKSWSRKYCVLRKSGLYFSKSGEPKKGKKMSDLSCLVMFEQTYLYLGRGWKKKFKAPFEYGFALKHPAIQMKSKHVRYLACEDVRSLMRWTVGIRLAKYGRDLLLNYEKTNEEMKSQSSVPALSLSYKHEAPADNISLKSSDSADSYSRTSTVPRNVGVKNVFEGAWQRANQADKPTAEQFNSNRVKSVFNSNQKKSSNWWDLQDQGQSDQTSNTPLSGPVNYQSNATQDSFANLPPPPTATFNDLPPPPPAFDTPMDSFLPPPPPSSNLVSSTFTSYDDPLPPPHFNHQNLPNSMKMPPPPVPLKTSHYSQNNNSNKVLFPDQLVSDNLNAFNSTVSTMYCEH